MFLGTSGDEENIYSIQKKEKSCQKLSEDKVEDNDLAETKKLRHHDEDIGNILYYLRSCNVYIVNVNF